MISFIYIIITLFLDNILSNILPYSYQNATLFFPMLMIVSLAILYFLIKDNFVFIMISAFLGLLYDFLYNDFFISVFIFILLSLIIIAFYRKRNLNIFNILFCSIIILIVYDTCFFFTLATLNYGTYTMTNLLYKISCSLSLNIIYALISYLILNKSLKKANKL